MKKTKKIIGIVLAAAVEISSLSAGTSVYADSEITSVQKHVVVLDPGHGGGESGASAVYKGKVYREEEINWKIANYTMQALSKDCLLYTSPSPRDDWLSRMPSSA